MCILYLYLLVQELSVDDLKELLLENEISNFDPVAEAYKIFDPRGEGSIDGNKLRAAFVSFGFGQLSDEEFEILKRVGSHAFVTLRVIYVPYGDCSLATTRPFGFACVWHRGAIEQS